MKTLLCRVYCSPVEPTVKDETRSLSPCTQVTGVVKLCDFLYPKTEHSGSRDNLDRIKPVGPH